MDFQRIFAVILRHFRLLLNDVNRIIMVLFWPFLDVIVWGFLGLWMKQQQNIPGLQIAFLTTILLWQVTNRFGQEMGLTFFEEIWSDNLVNFFATPLRINEWVVGSISFSCGIALAIAAYCIVLIQLMYSVPLSSVLWNFLIFCPFLLISGIFLGLLTLNLVLHFGKKGSEAAFIAGWVCAPFSSVFYPRDVLPQWAQKIGACLPMTYVFEGLRNYLLYDINPVKNLVISLIINIIYIFVTFLLFIKTFNRCKIRGLKRLTD